MTLTVTFTFPLTLTLTNAAPSIALGPQRLIFWRFVDTGTVTSPLGPGAITAEVGADDGPSAGGALLAISLTLARAGVYQVRMTSGRGAGVTLSLTAPHSLAYGVCFQGGASTPWTGMPPTTHVFVPANTRSLQLKGSKYVTLSRRTSPDASHPSGELASLHSSGSASTDKLLTTLVPGELLELAFTHTAATSYFANMPVILCSSALAAATIGGSTFQLTDGTWVYHRFQERLHQRRLELLAADLGSTTSVAADLGTVRDALVTDGTGGERGARYVGSFLHQLHMRALPWQNLNASSHWGGSFHGWQAHKATRWDHAEPLSGLRAGCADTDSYVDGGIYLAKAFSDEYAYNPYRGDTRVRDRALAGVFLDMMRIAEDDTFVGTQDTTYYPTMMAFDLAERTLAPFYYLGPHMSVADKALYAEALQHLVDRSYAELLQSTRNQNSMFLIAFAHFAVGRSRTFPAGEPPAYGNAWTAVDWDRLYWQLALDYGRYFRESASVGGIFDMEATGPDSTYQGITNYNVALTAQLLNDSALASHIGAVYTFYNHFVAPDHAGKMRGGFNFNQRTTGSFAAEQYNGAKGIVDAVVPAVGAWRGLTREWAGVYARWGPSRTPEQYIDHIITRSYALGTLGGLEFSREEFWTSAASVEAHNVTLPALEAGSFFRTFGSPLQAIAVKTPSYFASMYVGQPAGKWYTERLEIKFERDESKLGVSSGTPVVGGGLSLFHVGGYGIALLSTNWGPKFAHGVYGVRLDGTRVWADYGYSGQDKVASVNAASQSVVVQNGISPLSLRYERSYTFQADHVAVSIIFSASAAASLERFVETLPFPDDDDDAASVQLINPDGQELNVSASVPLYLAQQIVLRRPGSTVSPAVLIALDTPRNVSVFFREGPKGLWSDLPEPLSRVELALEPAWQSGDTFELHYNWSVQPPPNPP